MTPFMEYNEDIIRVELSLERGKNFEEIDKNNILHFGIGGNDLYQWMFRERKQK